MGTLIKSNIRHNWRDFSFALAIGLSALLHAGSVFFPYLGRHTVQISPSALSAGKQKSLSAILVSSPKSRAEYSVPAIEPDIGNAEISTQGELEAIPTFEQAPTAGIDILPMLGQAYFTRDQLSKPPQPVDIMDFESANIPNVSQSGKFVMRIWINAVGDIDRTELEKSELPDEVTDSIIRVFKISRFVPGERNGQRVGSMMRIEVEYESKPVVK